MFIIFGKVEIRLVYCMFFFLQERRNSFFLEFLEDDSRQNIYEDEQVLF